MEFHFRAGDERGPSTGAAATSANSDTAATRVDDGRVGGDGAGYHGESSPPAASSDPDELRRRAAKERIRERILREEAEAMELEAEVRRELMEERAGLLARLAGGSETTVPSLKTAPICHEPVQAGSEVDVPAAVPAKRKNPDGVAASAVLAATSSKKPKPDLTCTVCNITATSAVALQEHLRGKSHLKKAAKIGQPLPQTGHPEEDAFSLKVNGSAALPAKGENPDVVVASMTFAEKSCDNLGLNCTVCGITASSQKNMQDHLKGKTHMRKTAMLAQPLPKEDEVCSKPNASAAVLPAKRKNSDVVSAASTLSAGPSSKNQKQDLTCRATSEKGMQDHLKGKAHMKMAALLVPEEAEEEAEVEGGYTPRKIKMVTNSGTLCEVMQLNGSVLCEVCNVQTADLVTMMCHLQGSKHVSKHAKQKQCEAVEPPAAVAAGGNGPGSEMVPMEANGVGRVDGGSLLCELCNVKVPSECAMQSHLSGRKHTNKAKVAAVGVGACGNGSGSETVSMEANINGVRQLDGGILLCELCDVKAPSECVMRTHLSGRKHTNKQKATVDAGAGQEMKKADAAATVGSSSKEAASIVVNGSNDSVKKPAVGEMEVVVSSATPQVDVAFPVCTRVSSVVPMEAGEGTEAGDGAAKADLQEKADAEEEGAVEMDGGVAVTIGSSSKEAASIVVDGSDDSVKKAAAGEMEAAVSSATPQVDVAARVSSVAPMEVDEGTEAGDGAAKADLQEKADAEEEGAVEMDGGVAVTIGSSSKEAASIVVDGSDDSMKKPAAGEMEAAVSSATPQVGIAAPVCARVSSVPPMEVAEGAEAGDGTAKADEQEKADAEEEGAVQMDGGAAVTISSSSKEAASIVVNGSDDSVKKPAAGEMDVSSATPQVDVAAPVCGRDSSVEPKEVDEGAEAGDGAAKADEQERADAEEEGADAEEEGAVEEYNIQVGGKLFITLRQADGSLSCGLCGVHGCDKRGMIVHLYTRDHWRRARLAEENKRASEAVNKDGDGVPVTDGEAQVDN